jgi:hypothetical protein
MLDWPVIGAVLAFSFLIHSHIALAWQQDVLTLFFFLSFSAVMLGMAYLIGLCCWE